MPRAKPLDIGLTYGAFVRGRFDPSNRIVGNEWWRAMNSPGGPVTMRVRSDRANAAIHVDAWGLGREWVLDHADGIMGAHDDPHDFAPDDPLLAELHRRAPGFRIVRLGAAFDFAVMTILEQRVTSLEAHRSWRTLVARHGSPAPGPARLKVPPSPATLARLPDSEWRRLGVEVRRSGTVRRLAIDASRVDRACDEGWDVAERRLRSIHGIGPWTAQNITHFVTGDPDAVPVGDWHLPSHVAYALAGEHKADDARMLELLEPYRPHRARAWRLIVSGTDAPPRRAPRARIHDLIRAELRR